MFDKTNYEVLNKNIKHFILGDFELIAPKLNFNVSEKNYAYYLIHSIISHAGFLIKDIQNIANNGEDFIAENYSKAMAVINKKIRNNRKKTKAFFSVKDQIDILMEQNRKKSK